MTSVGWLIQEAPALDEMALAGLEEALVGQKSVRGGSKPPSIAVRVPEIRIADNRKWFGEANIRFDALVVHGHGAKDDTTTFYMPRTFRFPRVRDGDRLPIGDPGLLVFYGRPRFFLDIFLMVSRDRKDSEDLAVLLNERLGSEETKMAVGGLLGLAVADPTVATVIAAIEAATVIGDIALAVLRSLTGSTVGLYHASWLQYRDGFGVGRHPAVDSYTEKDFSFWYEVVPDIAPDPVANE